MTVTSTPVEPRAFAAFRPAKPAPRMITFGRDLDLLESFIGSALESTDSSLFEAATGWTIERKGGSPIDFLRAVRMISRTSVIIVTDRLSRSSKVGRQEIHWPLI